MKRLVLRSFLSGAVSGGTKKYFAVPLASFLPLETGIFGVSRGTNIY